MGMSELGLQMLPPAGQKTGRDDVDLFFDRLRQLHTEPYLCRTEKETGDILSRLVGRARSVIVAGLPTKVAKMVRYSLSGISCTSVEELVATDAVAVLAAAEVGVTWARHGVVNPGA